jgi:acetate kinase
MALLNSMKILVLNAGSSSQKSCVYDITGATLPRRPPQPLWESIVDWTHQSGIAEVKITTAQGVVLEEEITAQSQSEAIAHVLNTLWQGKTQVLNDLSEIDVVGHRVVHGGQRYQKSTFVTAEVKQAIAALTSFAPLHNPINLEGIEAIEQALGDVPQVAVFDTAFHAQLPLAAAVYPGPYAWFEQGIRRYGFHGISHQYCAQRTAQLMGKPLKDLHLIVCHLGNGCSLSAIRDGHSVDTTMGFTPLDGLMMGTRSGSVDPGILIYLLRQEGYSADQLEQILNKQSGLKGISGISADMRQITAAAADNSQAQLALDIFVHRLRSGIGAMLTSLDRLDALIFTAGVGENAPLIRAAACRGFSFLGLQIDPVKNEGHPADADIATHPSAVRVFVVHTQEDWAIAQECWHLLSS